LAVSGPPASLDDLVSSVHFQGVKQKAQAVYAPYHAPHLYSKADIEDILTPLSLDSGSRTLAKIPVLLGSGDWIKGTDFKDLLRGA